MNRMLGAVLGLIASMSLVSCGGSNPAVGTYKLDTASMRAAYIKQLAGAKLNSLHRVQLDTVDKATGTMVLSADGTCTVDYRIEGQPAESESGTWVLVGDKVVLTGQGKSGGADTTLELAFDGECVTFVLGPGVFGTRKFRKVTK